MNLILNQFETIEVKINLHCNLNCDLCSDHASFFNKQSIYDVDEFKEDFFQLSKFIKRIKVIKIIGGEPLINPFLFEYLDFLFNQTMILFKQIYIISNGTNINQNLIDKLIKKNIFFSINNYKKSIEIQNLKNVRHIDEHLFYNFDCFIPNNIIDEENFFCFKYGTCATLYRGKLFPCHRSVTTPHVFNLDDFFFIKDYIILKNLTSWRELHHLFNVQKKLEACRWCNGFKCDPLSYE